MEHGKKGAKFGRETKQRKALMSSLAESLITNSKITTTQSKAKALKTYIEKLITQAKKQNLSSTRVLLKHLTAKSTQKMIKELAPRFNGRNGGYTRVIKLNPRISDGSPMSIIEFV